jgi:hypothetical protein
MKKFNNPDSGTLLSDLMNAGNKPGIGDHEPSSGEITWVAFQF